MESPLVAVLCFATIVQAANIVVIGDSWGDEGRNDFADVFKARGSNRTIYNGAISGSTAKQWKDNLGNGYVKSWVTAGDVEDVWITLGGNDAQYELPACALKGGTPEVCTGETIESVNSSLATIIEFIHTANPKARIVGFGYDILGFGNSPGCSYDVKYLYPACNASPECVNTQFVKLQYQLWDKLAATYPYVRTVSLLGSLQALGGVQGASVGHPVLTKWSPPSVTQQDCIHPTIGKGFTGLFDNFYTAYWAKL